MRFAGPSLMDRPGPGGPRGASADNPHNRSFSRVRGPVGEAANHFRRGFQTLVLDDADPWRGRVDDAFGEPALA